MRKKQILIFVAIVSALIAVIIGCTVLLSANKAHAPATTGNTAGWNFTQNFGALYRSYGGDEAELLVKRSDLTVIGEDRIYYLDQGALYSINVDGSGLFKVAYRCVSGSHPDSLLEEIVTYGDQLTQAKTLGYYDGYVYVTVNSAHEAYPLARYKNGTREVEQVTDEPVSLFVISEDGILKGYRSYSNLMEAGTEEKVYEQVCEIDLNALE